MTYTRSSDQDLLIELRKKILITATMKRRGHIPSALSILDILFAIYIQLPKLSSKNVLTEDSFILSKGHAALALYAVLEQATAIDSNWMNTFSDFESDFGGHPDMRKIPGVNASTGSLGHGLPFSLGKVLAKRLKNNTGRVYCLIGDGEMNEGSIWESLLLASHHAMKELVLIVDQNNSNKRALNLGDLDAKFRAFGFNAITINGHSQSELILALTDEGNGEPKVIIAETVKGFGVSEMENNPAWHHAYPSEEQLASMLKELK